MPINGLDETSNTTKQNGESTNLTSDDSHKNVAEADNSDGNRTKRNSIEENKDGKVHRVQTWTEIRPSLCAIEELMSSRVKRNAILSKSEQLPSVEEAKPGKGASEEDSEEEFYDLERSESEQDLTSIDSVPAPPAGPTGHSTNSESPPPWKEELGCLVQGGVPMALRGEVKKRHRHSFFYLFPEFSTLYFFLKSCRLKITDVASLCWC